MREAEQFFVKEISFTRPAFSNLVFSSFPGTACNLLSRRINNRWNARLLKLMIKIQDFLVESKVQRVDLKRKLENPTKVKRFTNQIDCSHFENVKLSTVQRDRKQSHARKSILKGMVWLVCSSCTLSGFLYSPATPRVKSACQFWTLLEIINFPWRFPGFIPNTVVSYEINCEWKVKHFSSIWLIIVQSLCKFRTNFSKNRSRFHCMSISWILVTRDIAQM